MAHHHAGRHPEAEAAYRLAIAASPEDARALYHLSLILCDERRSIEAARLCGRAHALEPANPDYLECARFAHANAGLGDELDQLRAGAAQQADGAALVALGNGLRQQGDFDRAEDAYREAVLAAPGQPFAESRLGNLLATRGRYAEAQFCFAAAAKAGLKPDTLVQLDALFFAGLRARTAQLAAPAPQGDWGSTGRDFVVFLSCDQHYFDRFAYPLLNSLKQNGGADCLVHIHVVNPQAGLEQRIAALRASLEYPDIAFSHETIDAAACENPKTYYACSRFLHLPALQRRYGKPVLVLDADLLVIGRIDALLESLRDCDAGLIEYDPGRNDLCEHFWASVLYCGASPQAAVFFDDVALYIAHFLKAGQPVWFLDQVALFGARANASASGAAVRFKMLPGSLCQTSMTTETGRMPSDGDDTALFWSVTYSIPENAAKLELPEFRQYQERARAIAEFNRVKPCRYGTLLYNINDQYIGRALHEYAEFSQGEVDLFAKILRPGNIVVDAGANIGAHTVYFCRAVGERGRVHAFEPQRVVFQALCANIALNSFQNAHAYHAALGERAGTIKVDTPDYTRDNNFGGMPLGEWPDGEAVRLASVDEFELAACDFIKIDVEGMERSVIRGAGKTIARHRPVLYVENDRPENAAALIRQLDALDYALYWHLPAYFNPDNFARNPVNVFGNIASRNMLCLPRERSRGEFGLPPVDIPAASSP